METNISKLLGEPVPASQTSAFRPKIDLFRGNEPKHQTETTKSGKWLGVKQGLCLEVAVKLQPYNIPKHVKTYGITQKFILKVI